MAQRPRVDRQPPLLTPLDLDADEDVGERLAGLQRAHGRMLVVGHEEAVRVARPQLLAEHRVEALPHRDVPAEDALRGAVRRGDDPLVVADDDPLLEGRDHRGVALLERATRGLRATALGDVGADGHRTGDLLVLVEHLGHRDPDLEQRAVRLAVHGLELTGRLDAEPGVGADDVRELPADHRVAGPAVHLLGRGVPAVDAAVGVETDDRVGDVLHQLGLVAQRGFGLLAHREVTQDHLVRGTAVPLGADAERLDDDRRSVEAEERRLRRHRRGLVLLQRRDALERLEERVRVDELGERLAEVLVQVRHADEVGCRLVGPADEAVLVDDDAVRAQLEQQPVAVGLLLEGPLELAVGGDVGDDADAAGDRAVGVHDRAGPDEQAPLEALTVADRPLELVVLPVRAALDDGDDRVHEPGGQVRAVLAGGRGEVLAVRPQHQRERAAPTHREDAPGVLPGRHPPGGEREVVARGEPVGLARRDRRRRRDRCPGPCLRSPAQVFLREPSHAPPDSAVSTSRGGIDAASSRVEPFRVPDRTRKS